MAFKRSFLAALGIEADKVDEIMAAHIEVVNGLKSDLDKYKADADKLADVQKQLDKANEDLAKHGKDGETVSKKDYDAVVAERDEYKNKETKAAKQTAYRKMLEAEKVSEKHIPMLMKAYAADIESIELDKDGKVKNSEKYSETIKKEMADYIVTTQQKGANTAKPPATSGGTVTKEDFAKMSYNQRLKLYNENQELYKTLTDKE